jgi:hypothetical protein
VLGKLSSRHHHIDLLFTFLQARMHLCLLRQLNISITHIRSHGHHSTIHARMHPRPLALTRSMWCFVHAVRFLIVCRHQRYAFFTLHSIYYCCKICRQQRYVGHNFHMSFHFSLKFAGSNVSWGGIFALAAYQCCDGPIADYCSISRVSPCANTNDFNYSVLVQQGGDGYQLTCGYVS